MAININELKEQLLEVEQLKDKTEKIYHQFIGQVSILKKLIQKEEEKSKQQKQ